MQKKKGPAASQVRLSGPETEIESKVAQPGRASQEKKMAVGKKRGKIHVGGSINVQGPDILSRLASGEKITIDEGAGIEFYLKVKNGGSEDSLIEATPWLNISEADIEISTDAKDEEVIDDTVDIIIDGPAGRKFDLMFSIDQARIISRLIADYIQAHDLHRDMSKTYAVRGLVAES